MNRSPFIPHASPFAPAQAKRRSRTRIAVFTIVGNHVVLFLALLISGCFHSQPEAEIADVTETNPPPLVTTNPPAAVALKSETNLPPLVATPAPPPVAEPVVLPPVAKTYSVVKGDSFYRIAKAHGLSVSALLEANPGIEPTKLKIGQVLRFPVAKPKLTSPQTVSTTAPVKDKP
jgi:LysM repeat protein